ncbi:uncharacterized protein B0H64DRAFT_427232 [Chaetomium fimeti]|uniref:Ig-like domain-containing protein n=1 Tax=Chaetomium fimeti TaxID=1854472 RepID=A0AAE0H7A8_9PEZI|nr:hypothetical protein B0H64DRAFT_427232 [Chaetomium fimeti]
MRNNLVSIALATAATLCLPFGVNAARPCGGADGGSFQYRLGDVRYDGPDPSKNNDLATIAASLQSNTQTPLYECVGQWPEAWAGWYQGGSNLIWADCIWTGAGTGQDDTVSFAVDWENKTMYLAHTFACSDQEGSQGLATGSITLDVNCTTTDESSYCVPKSTESGTRPNLNIATVLVPGSETTEPTCAETSKEYQSWKVEQWQRSFTMEPGASPTDPNLSSDTGPSFTLKSSANGNTFNCSPSEAEDGSFVGSCTSDATTTTADFHFDPLLNMLEISEHWACDGSPPLDVVGVGYVQAACERVFNSDEFVCTSAPVWIGTGVV